MRTHVRQRNAGSLPIGTAKRTPLASEGSGVRALLWLLPVNTTAAHFASEDHKPSSPARTHQLWVSSFFPPSCCCQGDSIMLGRTTSSCPVRAHRAHQRGVDDQLHSSKQGKPISHDFKSSAVKGLLWNGQVQITDHDIRSDPRARLTTDLRSCQLHCEPTS